MKYKSTASQSIIVAALNHFNETEERIEFDPEDPASVDAAVAAIEKLYYHFVYTDYLSEFRCSGVETGLELRQRSLYYDCREVAAETEPGRWVGWTYWYGGGKHGDPDAIDWIGGAYDVERSVEMREITVFKVPGVAEK